MRLSRRLIVATLVVQAYDGAMETPAMRLACWFVVIACSACAASTEPAPEPKLAKKSAAELRTLLDGVWKLENIDGQPARGWLSFKNGSIWFTLTCGASYGTFALDGDVITVEAPYSTMMDCDKMAPEPGPPLLAPSFLWHTFRVQVSERALVLSARSDKSRHRFAQYSRSSVHAIYQSWRKKR